MMGRLVGLAFISWAGALQAASLTLQAELSHPVRKAGEKKSTYLKVSTTGGAQVAEVDRAPINLTLVLDRSSSMNGEKIVQARQAAKLAVSRLQPNDIISVVAYDNVVEVLVPATKASDKEAINRLINNISTKGNTALFGGVAKGAEELRKFKQRDAINRVVLLSDGQANVGPSDPKALGDLGAALAQEGISVTTIGLGGGYNEDLMDTLAMKSDGNHSFVQTPGELAAVFEQELGTLASVVASDVEFSVTLGEGIRPVRALGRDVEIQGQTVSWSYNQVYAEQEKFLLLEVESIPQKADTDQLVATAKVDYLDAVAKKEESTSTRAVSRILSAESEVEIQQNREVMIAVVAALATEKSELAVKLRDEGKIKEAQIVITENRDELEKQAVNLSCHDLHLEADRNGFDNEALLDDRAWTTRRKAVKQRGNVSRSQNRAYRSVD